MATDIVLQSVVIRYPHLDAPWTGNPTIPEDYQCQLIFPQTFAQWEQLQATVNEAIATCQKFAGQTPANLKLPWLNQFLQPKLQEDGPYAGCYFIGSKGKGTKPTVVDGNVQVIPDLQIKQAIFSGCIVNAHVNFGGYQVSSPGVACYLKSIQLVNNQVEPIADAGQDPSAVFQAIPGAPAPIAPAAPAPFSPQDPLTVKPQGGGW